MPAARALPILRAPNAGVAQLVEQSLRKREVGGSSPSTGTMFSGLRASCIRRPRGLRAIHRLGFCAACLVAVSTTSAAAVRAVECLPDCPCPMPILLDSRGLPVKVDQALLQRQFEVLRRMSLENVEYSPLGPITEVWGDTGLVLPPEALKLKEGDSGTAILRLLGDLLLANGDEILTLKEAQLYEGPYASIGGMSFLQSIRGIPVINGVVAFNYDGKTKRIKMLSAGFIPNRELPLEPKLTVQEAERLVPGEVMEPSYLGYYLKCCGASRPRLVWAVHAWSSGLGKMFYVDAITGAIVDVRQTTIVG